MIKESIPLLLMLLAAYLLGAVPFGLVLTRWFTGVDIRKEGSRNIGATNVRRTAGNFLGFLTLAADAMKGALPVFCALRGIPVDSAAGDIWVSAMALSAFLGHLYPVYSGFRGGGKGVATGAGCFLVISAPACLSAVAAFALVVMVTRRVSAGSLAAAAVLPAAAWGFTGSGPFLVAALVIFLMVSYRHRENIGRLMSGREPPL